MCSNPGQVIPKTSQKMVVAALFVELNIIKVELQLVGPVSG